MIKEAIKASDFKIRCSATGKIMADTNGDELIPKGAITYLNDWHYEKTTGERLFNGNRYTKKGWLVENDAIDDYEIAVGYFGENLVKNEDFFSNDYTEGTPDILVDDDLVVDIKAPYKKSKFDEYASYRPTERYPAPNSAYFWQLQSYMWITERTRAELAYVLINTPKELIVPKWGDEWVDYEGSIPVEKRVKIFGFNRSFSHICRIEERVKRCKEYIHTVLIPDYENGNKGY